MDSGSSLEESGGTGRVKTHHSRMGAQRRRARKNPVKRRAGNLRSAAACPTSTPARPVPGNGPWKFPKGSHGKSLSTPWNRARGRHSERGSNDGGAERNPDRRGRKEAPFRGSPIHNGMHTRLSRHASSCEPYPSPALRKRRGGEVVGLEDSRATYSSDI